MTKVEAPWTAEQVSCLNEYQASGAWHPFTCPNRSDGKHNFALGDLGVLVAHEDGWACPSCNYVQGWAHSFMADESWRELTDVPWLFRSDSDGG